MSPFAMINGFACVLQTSWLLHGVFLPASDACMCTTSKVYLPQTVMSGFELFGILSTKCLAQVLNCCQKAERHLGRDCIAFEHTL